jgi:hypothetical protein
MVVHASLADLDGGPNEGLTRVGLVLGHKF